MRPEIVTEVERQANTLPRFDMVQVAERGIEFERLLERSVVKFPEMPEGQFEERDFLLNRDCEDAVVVREASRHAGLCGKLSSCESVERG